MEILNKQNLEKTLLANWTNFIDIRQLMNFVKLENNCYKVNKITLSRFEPIDKGFIVWIEFDYLTDKNSDVIKGMNEVLLTLNNKLLLI